MMSDPPSLHIGFPKFPVQSQKMTKLNIQRHSEAEGPATVFFKIRVAQHSLGGWGIAFAPRPQVTVAMQRLKRG